MTRTSRTAAVRRRRSLEIGLLVVAAVAVAAATALLAWQSGGERVTRLWVAATLADDGSARVVEVVDYDFGPNDRHGIFRVVPGLRQSAPVQVSSPDAPHAVTLEPTPAGTRLRIGNPDRTVSGRHRYVLSYTLDGVARDGRLAWDAVGTGWDVAIDEAEVHLVAPEALTSAGCSAGSAGSTARCAIEGSGTGTLAVRVHGLESHEGVTLRAAAGAPLSRAPALPSPPAVAPVPTGTGPLAPGALAGVSFLLVSLLVSRLLRRAGRERLPDTGVPVPGGPDGQARIDLQDLAGYATPSSTVPRLLTPAQGGILLSGAVRNQHKAAWLIDEAVAGTIDLEGRDPGHPKEITLVRRQPGDEFARPVLDRAFRDRDRLTLGRYDKNFADAWRDLGAKLDAWQRRNGLEDLAARRRAGRIRVAGGVAAAIGIAVTLLGGYLSARAVGLPLLLAAVGGAASGAGLAAAVRGWELRVLTPEGSAAWLQVESLRQYLAMAPPAAIDEAVAAGRVGEYTAWAVALGEAGPWSQLASSVSAPGASSDLRYATYAPVFVSSCTSASVSPSSSAAGGAGVGGGAGGGGGGSW